MTPAVILAGGRGERLRPLTDFTPKPLLEVEGEAMVNMVMRRLSDSSASPLTHFVLMLSHEARQVREYFRTHRGWEIKFIENPERLGTAGSLRDLLAEPGLISFPFIVANCDSLITADLSGILSRHRTSKLDATIVAARRRFRIPYGVVKRDQERRLHTMTEKPIHEFLVNTGVYVLSRSMLELLPDGPCDMPHLLMRALELKKSIEVAEIPGAAWRDLSGEVAR